ncbi:MAG: hypothetical protein IBX47_11545 [Desulfuromonadales bacterium]|nr:hypothetical protein [Desulfuromonadales bacterium]
MGKFRGEIGADFRHQLGIHREDFRHKLDLVVEGQQMLAEKLDRVEDNLKGEMHKVDQRVTAMSADLAEHRHDTEAHRKGRRVSEGE